MRTLGGSYYKAMARYCLWVLMLFLHFTEREADFCVGWYGFWSSEFSSLFLLYLPAPCSFWIALCSTNTANYFSCRRFHGILWTWNVLIIVHLLEITVISSPVLICSWQTAAALSALFYEYSPECLHFLAKWLEWLWFTNECLLSNATELTSYISSCQGPKPTLRAMCPTATITASNPCLQFVCRWVNRFFLRI